MKKVSARIIAKTELMPDVHLVWLRAPEIAEVCRPGQFVMVRCEDGHDPLLRRPFSIHRVAGGDQIALLFSVVGRGSLLLSQYKEGDNLDLLGPLGNGFALLPGTGKLLLAAGGMGIAPLVFLADHVLDQGLEVVLLSGSSGASCVYPRSLLPSSVDVIVATEDGSVGRRGLVTDLIADSMNKVDQVFACGPVSMYQSMSAHGSLRGRSVQISLEIAMGCGLGACYGCTIRTRSGLRQVCSDGPVFELDDILW